MAEVEIYTTMWCPYCARAKCAAGEEGRRLSTRSSLDEEPNRRGEMVQRADGGRTVPQIFIDGEHIGGCDDIDGARPRRQARPQARALAR